MVPEILLIEYFSGLSIDSPAALKAARWTMPLGGPGVMLVSAMPTFGGGIWLASFFAYALHLNRRAGYAWIIMGSVLSYVSLYWILVTLVRTVQYFVH